jgi:hypothetical protein
MHVRDDLAKGGPSVEINVAYIIDTNSQSLAAAV